MRQEVYSKCKEMHNEMSGQRFLKRKMKKVKSVYKKTRLSHTLIKQLNRHQQQTCTLAISLITRNSENI